MFIVSGGLVRTGLISRFTRIVSRRAAQNKVLVLIGRRAAHRRRVGLHQQHPAGRGDDPGHDPARAQHGARAVETADPAVLPDRARRHDLHDRHLDQHPRRRRRPRAGTARRSDCSRSRRWGSWSRSSASPPSGCWCRALLPNRDSMVDLLGARKRIKFFTEVVVPEGSPLIGQPVMAVGIFRRDGMRVIDVLRGDELLRRQFPEVAAGRGRPGGAAHRDAGAARASRTTATSRWSIASAPRARRPSRR